MSASTTPEHARRVTRVLYKQLLRLAYHFDTRPALKALTPNPLYSRHAQWHRVDRAIEKFYGRSLAFYLEPRSMQSLVRQEFRARSPGDGDNVSECDSVRQYHSDCFAVLKILKRSDVHYNDRDQLNFDNELLSVDPATPSDARIPDSLMPHWPLRPLIRFPPPSPSLSSSLTASSEPISWAQSDEDAAASPSNKKRGRKPKKFFRTLAQELEETPIKRGSMFVAHPGINAWPFDHSVFLVTDHSDNGEMRGLVLNKPVADQGLYSRSRHNDIEEQLWRLYQRYLAVRHAIDHAGQSGTDAPNTHMPLASPPLLCGGPVRPSLTILHRLEAFADVSDTIIAGEYPVYKVDSSKFVEFGEKLHEQIRVIEERGLSSLSSSPSLSLPVSSSQSETSDILVFLGHSAWTPNQLRAELSKGDWLPVQGNGLHVFNHPLNAAAAVKISTKAKDTESASESAGTGDSSDEAVSRAVSMLISSRPPPLTFPSKHLWSHAWHVLGGEFHHFAAIEAVEGSEANLARQKRQQARNKTPTSPPERKESDNTGNIP